MTEDPGWRQDNSQAASWDKTPPELASGFLSPEPHNHVTEVASALAAHGGGPIALDLALDLVLHQIVEQARDISGANGAAIALMRDGEMVCRATAGENAPDLGVRVETTSGLAGACVHTGEMQQCRDTETDARVNAEACHRLGVRSMLVAPLTDEGSVFGVLQVFSALPNAFGETEVRGLQRLTTKVVESRREAANGFPSPPIATKSFAHPLIPEQREDPGVGDHRSAPPSNSRSSDVLSSVLMVLVVGVAIVLGLAIGWRSAAKFVERESATRRAVPLASSAAPAIAPDQNTPQAAGRAGNSAYVSPSQLSISNVPSRVLEAGGLVITQNGKVVYRSVDNARLTPSESSAESRLIHRVEPEYPAAARAQKIQGPVVLDVRVLGNGKVGDVAVVSGDPLLAGSAVEAVKQWRYRPYLVDGRPVEGDTRITIRFTLPAS